VFADLEDDGGEWHRTYIPVVRANGAHVSNETSIRRELLPQVCGDSSQGLDATGIPELNDDQFGN
jgi:hypothetical protein